MDDPRAPADPFIPLTVAQLVAILERLDNALLIQHRSGAIAFVNDAAARLCGFDTAAAMRAVPIDAVLRRFTLHDATGHLLPLSDLPARRVLAGEPIAETTVRWRSVATGEERWSAVRATAVPDDAGQPAYVLSVFQDITDLVQERTERTRLYRETQAAEERYRALLAGVGDAVLVADAAGNYIDANPAMVELLGYTVEELRQMRVGDLTAGVPSDFAQEIHTLPDGSRRGEMELRRKDGTVIPVEGWVTSVDLPTGRLFLGTWRDISARRAAEEERQRFIAMIAHELRNPLSSLIGYAELMRRRERFDPRAVETIIAQGRRLERLTLDLRDAMRIGGGVPLIHRAAVNARTLIADAVEQAQTTTTAHTITVTMPDALPPARWDADRIAQVLGNLLLNAIKYSVDGGDVRVRVEDRGDHLRVAVTDTGIGIPPEALPAIFAPFYRAANAREGSARGMGLGLPISKALVEAHGGEMWAESTLGQGSTFIFTLPYLPPDDASDTAQPSGM